MSLRLAVLASGGGSNLQALLDAFAESDLARVVLVVSDRASTGALERARRADVTALHIPATDSSALEAAVADHRVDMIALAGYLRLVPKTIVQRFRQRILNVHPALLPAFGGPGMYGLRVHEAVLAAGSTITGVTVHHVDERYDEGSIIAQWPVPVHPEDSPATLAGRVLRVEHILYPAVVAALARITLGQGQPPGARFEAFRAGLLAGVEQDVRTIIRIEGRP